MAAAAATLHLLLWLAGVLAGDIGLVRGILMINASLRKDLQKENQLSRLGERIREPSANADKNGAAGCCTKFSVRHLATSRYTRKKLPKKGPDDEIRRPDIHVLFMSLTFC